MSWQFVFKHVLFTFSTIEEAAVYAFHGGYEFFEWNGDIYFLYEICTDEFSVGCLKTSIKSGDLV